MHCARAVVLSLTVVVFWTAPAWADESIIDVWSAQWQAEATAERKIAAALAKPVTVQFDKTPLDEALESLAKSWGVPIVWDRFALEWETDFDKLAATPITLAVSNVSASAVLELVLDQAELDWVVKHEVIVVTSRDVAEDEPSIRVHPLVDWNIADEEFFHVADKLRDRFEGLVSPLSWRDVGGCGHVEILAVPQVLLVLQTRRVHNEVEQLLPQLRRGGARQPVAAEPQATASDSKGESASAPKPTAPTRDELALLKISAALNGRLDVDFADAPLHEALDWLAESIGVNLVVDEPALREGRDKTDLPIRLAVNGLSARAALELTLRQADLDWVIQHEVIRVTSRDRTDDILQTRCYWLVDWGFTAHEAPLLAQELMQAILEVVAPHTWEEVGGAGAMRLMGDSGGLVIRQSRDAHEQLARLLFDLRAVPRPARTFVRSLAADARDTTTRRRAPTHQGSDAGTALLGERLTVRNFDVALYQQLAAGHDGNVLVSPPGVEDVLVMLLQGGHRVTRNQIVDMLRWSIPTSEAIARYGRQRRELTAAAEEPGGLNVVAGFWSAGDRQQAAFVEHLRDNFDAVTQRLESDREAARTEINRWIRLQTNGQIREAFPPAVDFGEFVAVSIIAFQNDWQFPFDASRTREAPFHGPRGTTQAPMMRRRMPAGYLATQDALCLRLPFADEEFYMQIVLPRDQEGGLTALEQSLSAEKFLEWKHGFKTETVDVHLPRMNVATQYDLGDALKRMGAPAMFSPRDDGSGGFDGIFEHKTVFARAALQANVLELNEQGVEAASATIIGGFGAPPTPKIFCADRPFLYFIVHRSSGAVIFMGRCSQP